LDFSKAFDTVRHSTLLAKMAELELPAPVYNWLVDFFREHAHRTMFNGEESSTATISTSIIQGSGIGPAAYTVIAADLKPFQHGNSMVKFTDYTYLVVPSVNASAGDGQHCNSDSTQSLYAPRVSRRWTTLQQ